MVGIAHPTLFFRNYLGLLYYSDFQSYKVHLSPLIACGEGVGGGVLVPDLMTIYCKLLS